MWPEMVKRWLARMQGTPAGNLPPLETYQDSLRYLVGGLPEVVHKPMQDGLYGTYDPPIPTIRGTIGGVPFRTENGRERDTITVNSAPQSDPLPYDFVFAHEMGHRLFHTTDPSAPAQMQFSQERDPIRRTIGQMRHEGGNSSEDFARSFAAAMEQVRQSGYKPPDWALGGTAPIYVNAIANWAKKRLGAYDRQW